MLAHRLRRCPSITPTPGQYVVFSGGVWDGSDPRYESGAQVGVVHIKYT